MSSSQHGKSKTCQNNSISFYDWTAGPVNTKRQQRSCFSQAILGIGKERWKIIKMLQNCLEKQLIESYLRFIDKNWQLYKEKSILVLLLFSIFIRFLGCWIRNLFNILTTPRRETDCSSKGRDQTDLQTLDIWS